MKFIGAAPVGKGRGRGECSGAGEAGGIQNVEGAIRHSLGGRRG